MSDLDKNMAVKSMVVMRKAFRIIDAKVSETFKNLIWHQLNLGLAMLEVDMKIGELIDHMLATSSMTVVIKNMEKRLVDTDLPNR